MIVFLIGLALAAPAIGVDFVPMGRADLVWVDAAQASGTLVGEFDGLVRPNLTPYLVVQSQKKPRNTFVLGTGFARTAETSWTGQERRKVVTTAIRPAVDLQRYVIQDTASAWVGLGAFGVIPIVRDVSTAYGEAEAQEAREGSREVMARIGGAGARVGAGAELAITPELSIGLRFHTNAWRGQRVTEDSVDISTLMWVDAGLRLQIQL